jgi:deoxyribose-phosphate aldolase
MGNTLDKVDSTDTAAYHAPATYEELAGMIEHSLVRPDLTEDLVASGCRLAYDYRVAAAVVKPCDVDIAVRILDGSGVAVASVAGFPHGSSNTATKLYEGRDLLRRGAKEIGLVVNFGKMNSRQFQYVETEIMQMAESCHQSNARCKVIFETGFLSDELKIILCKIVKRAGADFAETCTSFGPAGYRAEDAVFLKTYLRGRAEIKASGGIRTLDQALAVHADGCSRFGTTQTEAILDEWKARLKKLASQQAVEQASAS